MHDDSDRWRPWLARHGAALVLFARQWSANSADAQDAVQDGFVRFWKTRLRANDEAAYLYACVRSAAMDLGRRQRRRDARERATVHSNQSDFESPLEQVERQEMIAQALNQLPADQREVIVMKIWGGLTFAQIAKALDLPLNTAASRYRYALARLHAELSEEVTHD